MNYNNITDPAETFNSSTMQQFYSSLWFPDLAGIEAHYILSSFPTDHSDIRPLPQWWQLKRRSEVSSDSSLFSLAYVNGRYHLVALEIFFNEKSADWEARTLDRETSSKKDVRVTPFRVDQCLTTCNQLGR